MAFNSLTHIRMSGLASGLDTDKLIYDMMRAERVPLDRVIQNKQLTEWKQEEYRSIINLLDDFNKSFMDVLNPSTNMRSSAQYKKLLSSVTNSSGVKSSALVVNGTVDSSVGNHKITVINHATSAKQTSLADVTAPLQTKDLRGELLLNGKNLNITLDGVTRTISFNSDFSINDQVSGEEFASQLESLITNAFGSGIDGAPKVEVSYDNETGKVSFNTSGGASKITINEATNESAHDILGIANFSSNRLNTALTLENLKDSLNGGLNFYNDNGVDKIKFSINNKEFIFNSDTKLSIVINTINNDATANVDFYYDSIKDKFVITSKKTGAGNNIAIENSWGNFFGVDSATNIDHTTEGFGANGSDAIVNIDGIDLVRSSNIFTVDGNEYNIANAVVNEEYKVSLSVDVDGIYENIKSFIDKYNEILDKINNKINERYNRNYPPLTDDQKNEMKDNEIEKWEEKAKIGLLQNDSTLQKIINNLRMQVINPVEGVSKSLSSIGISSKSYLDYGKLSINESKLKDAILKDPDSIMDLFAKQSTTLPIYDRKANLEQRNSRFKEEGLVNRIYDIIQDNISIMMDSSGNKGLLLEKAGIVGDSTERTSILSKQIIKDEKLIFEWENRLLSKEESLYKKFTAMERALSKLNSQSSWLSQQLFGSSI